jgi:hypothetical protein
MSVTFSILDESTAGQRYDAGLFACDSDTTTLREIIRVRVKQEVDRFNRTDAPVVQLLVQPEETERLLNGVRPTQRIVDWEKQYAKAIAAFESNGFLVLVGERQILELDERVELAPETQVTFLKLVPLIGG